MYLPLILIPLILLGCLGAALGSFFNVLIERLPAGRSIVKPPSHCSSCGKNIPAWLNIPILSYLALGGKCKYCQSPIRWHHLIVEILTPILLILVYLRFGLNDVRFYKFALLTCFLIPIFFIDMYHHLIHNVLSIPLLISGFAFALITGSGVGIINAFLTALVVFTLMLGLFYLYLRLKGIEGVGGGDLWLMAAISAYFGFVHVPLIFFLAALLALIYYLVRIRNPQTGIAFGPFIAVSSYIWIFVQDHAQDLLLTI